jgi:flavin reductase (DIM6/NTAB) family NADH-FMN oxidoreductase RutF
MADTGVAVRDEPGLHADAALALYRRLAGCVTVVTAAGPDGPTGCTATSVTSASLRPPLILACLAERSRTLAAVRDRGAFGVHVLASDQHQHAWRFARTGRDKFAGAAWQVRHGVPVLVDNAAWAVCRLTHTQPLGDHHLVVGEVVAARATDRAPLLWHDRQFRHLAAPVPADPQEET